MEARVHQEVVHRELAAEHEHQVMGLVLETEVPVPQVRVQADHAQEAHADLQMAENASTATEGLIFKNRSALRVRLL